MVPISFFFCVSLLPPSTIASHGSPFYRRGPTPSPRKGDHGKPKPQEELAQDLSAMTQLRRCKYCDTSVDQSELRVLEGYGPLCPVCYARKTTPEIPVTEPPRTSGIKTVPAQAAS